MRTMNIIREDEEESLPLERKFEDNLNLKAFKALKELDQRHLKSGEQNRAAKKASLDAAKYLVSVDAAFGLRNSDS